jgi:predicted nucleic acid-binding protein
VLESFYRLSRAEVVERALAVAHMDGLALDDADLVTDALFVYETARIDFIDAYNACWMKEQGLSKAVTFDENHFSRVDWVTIERLQGVE